MKNQCHHLVLSFKSGEICPAPPEERRERREKTEERREKREERRDQREERREKREERMN